MSMRGFIAALDRMASKCTPLPPPESGCYIPDSEFERVPDDDPKLMGQFLLLCEVTGHSPAEVREAMPVCRRKVVKRERSHEQWNYDHYR